MMAEKTPLSEKEKRLKAALRQNLRRRKAAARKDAPAKKPSETGDQ
ncbi:MAG: hypothetical protein AAF296_00865 [Pseudomonadota bacterium]